eukprot:411557-Ditylum_brightwellii.AAC.1
MFGVMQYCKAPLTLLQAEIEQEIETAAYSASTFAEFISAQPAHIRHILGTLDTDNINVDYWIRAINDGKVTIAIDGSMAQQKGYFATVLHTDERQLQFQGPCNCYPCLILLHWTEFTRILAALYLICALRTNAPPEPGICACLEVEYDITPEILNVKDNGIDLSTVWVKAHQDNNMAVKLLPLDVQPNI